MSASSYLGLYTDRYRYEGRVLEETSAPSRQSGQLGGMSARTTPFLCSYCTDPSTLTKEPSSEPSADRAQKTTENIRYGQNISESGMGGKTTTSSGDAGQEGGYGGVERQKSHEEIDAKETREAQGYGPGSGVGA